MDKSNNRFPLGNEWLKVDLHIHSPIFGNCYSDSEYKDSNVWEEFYKELNGSGLDVIGINDYFTLEGYKKVKQAKKEGKLDNIKLILPVIEFRIKAFAGSPKLNWHIIFDDTLGFGATVDHINSYLKRSGKTSDGKTTFHPCIKSMEAEKKTIFKCDDGYCLKEEGLDKFLNNECFCDRMISVLSYNELKKKIGDDFTETIKNITSDIIDNYRLSGLFTASTFDIAKSRLQGLQNNDSLKNLALINCSDKHNFKGKPGHCNDFTKFSWMKTIPTFQGIQSAIKNYKDRIIFQGEGFIKSLHNTYKIKNIVSNIISNDKNHKIEFNQNGLISIIGHKSQGKSLLGTMVAQINKDNEEALKVYKELVNKEDIKFNNDNEVSFIKCKLLSQNYIQKITQPNINGHIEELQEAIKRIVFSYDKGTKTKIDGINDKIEVLQTKIKDLNKTFIDELKYNSIKKDLDDLLNNKEGEKQELEKEKEVYNQITNTEEYKDLNTYKEEISTYNKYINNSKRLQDILNKHYMKLQQWKQQTEALNNEINRSLDSYKGCMDTEEKVFDNNSFNINLNELTVPIENIKNEVIRLSYKIEEYQGKIKGLKNKIEEGEASFKTTSENRGIDADSLKDVNTRDAQINAIKADIQFIEKSKKEITKHLELVDKSKKEHKETFKELFGLFADQKKNYNSIIQKIYDEIEEHKEFVTDLNNIGFEAKYNEDFLKTYVEDINNNCINKVKFSTVYSNTEFHSKNDTNDIIYFGNLNQQIIESKDDEFTSHIDTLYDEICATFLVTNIKDNLKGEYKLTNLPTKQSDSEVSADIDRVIKDIEKSAQDTASSTYPKIFLDKIFNIKLDVHYNITYNKKLLNNLSHGARGTALTLIYLLLDIDDNKKYPLVIDQPEDHIDSSTIQNSLVPAFKKAKKSRQIFLITHNPNLVVNTDSDQVIIASTENDKDFKYTCGSIDDENIIEQICSTLEGGKEAFKIRKNRYKTYIKDAQ